MSKLPKEYHEIVKKILYLNLQILKEENNEKNK